MSNSENSESFAHDTYTHGEDGRVCIPIDDYWFVPTDAGGDGYTCTRPHGPVRADDEATIEEIQRVARHWQKVETRMCKHETLVFENLDGPYCSECKRPVRFLSDIQIEEMKKHAVPADNHQ